jgi:ATP-binding cassette subfamily G (WHITE) protein 2 (PDR)
MDSTGDREFQPIRTENILSSHHSEESSNAVEPSQRPSMIPSSSSTDCEENGELERTETNRTSRSAREQRHFEPIRSGDREELQKIATEFGGSVELQRTATVRSSRLQRKDTLYGIQLGDSVLDPSSPDFDVYKWSRM